MFKAIVTEAVISKGYDGAPAFRFSENGDSVRFRFGKKVFDFKAENNTRWVNMAVKAFGPACERIKKMQLKEGSLVNLIGRLDEETWEDQTTRETKSKTVIILDEIEYAGGGSRTKDDQNQQSANAGSAPAPAANTAQNAPQNSSNFQGYEPFSSGSFFDEN